jgi:hypothetical protein
MGTTMDVAEFDCWLSGIAALTTPQRRQAWQTLALSEASDCDDTETGPHWGGDIDDSGAAATPDQPPTFTPPDSKWHHGLCTRAYKHPCESTRPPG